MADSQVLSVRLPVEEARLVRAAAAAAGQPVSEVIRGALLPPVRESLAKAGEG